VFFIITGRIHKIGEDPCNGAFPMDWMDKNKSVELRSRSAATTAAWAGHRVNIIDTRVTLTSTVGRLNVHSRIILVLLHLLDCFIRSLNSNWNSFGVKQRHWIWVHVSFSLIKRKNWGLTSYILWERFHWTLQANAFIQPITYGCEDNFSQHYWFSEMKAENLWKIDLEVIIFREEEIPAEYLELVKNGIYELVESCLLKTDEDLIGRYSWGEEISQEELKKAYPYCNDKSWFFIHSLLDQHSKTKRFSLMLDAVIDYLQSPLMLRAIEGVLVEMKTACTSCRWQRPFLALAFKVMTDPLLEFNFLSCILWYFTKRVPYGQNSSKGKREV